MGENDKDVDPTLPWVFRVKPPPQTARAGVDPALAVYRLFENTRNPFLRRVPVPNTKTTGGAKEPSGSNAPHAQQLIRLLVDQCLYRSGPHNVEEPLRRRQLEHIRVGPPRSPQFQEPRSLPGDPRLLPVLVSSFFENVLAQLQQHPGTFFEIIEEVRELLAEYEIRIRIPEAFQAFEDWEHLMETLEEISRYPAPETFDLFCGALLAYDELVEGDGT